MIAISKTCICILNILTEGIFKTILLLYSISITLYNEYEKNMKVLLLSTLQKPVQILCTFLPRRI